MLVTDHISYSLGCPLKKNCLSRWLFGPESRLHTSSKQIRHGSLPASHNFLLLGHCCLTGCPASSRFLNMACFREPSSFLIRFTLQEISSLMALNHICLLSGPCTCLQNYASNSPLTSPHLTLASSTSTPPANPGDCVFK